MRVFLYANWVVHVCTTQCFDALKDFAQAVRAGHVAQLALD